MHDQRPAARGRVIREEGNVVTALRVTLGIALLVVGMPLLCYAAVLDMAHLSQNRWFDRPDLLAPAAVVLLVAGVLLTRV